MSQRVWVGLILSAAFLFASAARAQEIEATPAAPTQVEEKPIVAIAPLQDHLYPALAPESLAVLDGTLWSTISSCLQARYDLIRLTAAAASCDSACAIQSAKESAARFVIVTAMQQSPEGYHVVAAALLVDDRLPVHTSSSGFFSEPSQLPTGIRDVTVDVAQALYPKLACRTKASLSADGNDFGQTTPARGRAAYEGYRAANMSSPQYARARSRRNGGVGVFILSIAFDAAGGGLLGAGVSSGEESLIITGAALEGAGVIFFFAGLGAWVANQIRMNKIERGIPLSRSLRLEGLSPIVASREGVATGLDAVFAF
jgi:hypothetical protein